jgi:large subunit ribosomal protein L7e
MLIKGRGYAMINEKRTLLNDNKIIEKAIGESTGCICLEDIIHEIANLGPNFDAVSILQHLTN